MRALALFNLAKNCLKCTKPCNLFIKTNTRLYSSAGVKWPKPNNWKKFSVLPVGVLTGAGIYYKLYNNPIIQCSSLNEVNNLKDFKLTQSEESKLPQSEDLKLNQSKDSELTQTKDFEVTQSKDSELTQSKDSELTQSKDSKLTNSEDSKLKLKPTDPAITKYEIPESIPYLIIGSGAAAYWAMRTIRSKNPKARVLLISEEEYPPYKKAPLVNEMWNTSENNSDNSFTFERYEGKRESLFFEPNEFYCTPIEAVLKENGGVGFLPNAKVIGINSDKQRVVLENGQTIAYEKLLIASNAKPKDLSVQHTLKDDIKNKVGYLRSIKDFRYLQNVSKNTENITIVGGNILSSELAWILGNKASLKVNLIVQENGLMTNILPAFLSTFITDKLKKHNINVIRNSEINKVESLADDKLKLTLSNGESIETNFVVSAAGVDANIDLATKAGLETDPTNGGLLVNSEFSVSSNVWAAGEIASFYDPNLKMRRRVDFEEHAYVSGKLVGQNMMGGEKKFSNHPMFWFDLGKGMSYEAVGLVDSSLETRAYFSDPKEVETKELKSPELEAAVKKPDAVAEIKLDLKLHNISSTNDEYTKGVIFYLKDDILVGIGLWNVYDQLTTARRVLKMNTKFEDLTQVARLFKFNSPSEEEETVS